MRAGAGRLHVAGGKVTPRGDGSPFKASNYGSHSTGNFVIDQGLSVDIFLAPDPSSTLRG